MDETRISAEKKLTLLLLCWLLGIFGVHRFYSGKYITGAMQLGGLALSGGLMLLDTGILQIFPPIVLLLSVIVDFFMIIMGKFTDKEGRPIIDWT